MRKYDSYKSSGNEWIGEIPNHWEVYRLGMLGTFSSSGIDKNSNDDEVNVRMVNYTDLVQGRNHYPIQTGEREYMRVTTPDSKLKEHKLKKGDMVFIPSSETEVDLGYSSLIDFDEDDIVYSYHILRFRFNKEIYHFFKKYLVNHHSVLNQFSSEGKGTTRQIIGRNVFNNVRVVIPPLSEQNEIVSFLDTKTSQIDSLIEKTQQKIELLKEKRTSLINEVVTKGLNPNVEMKDSGVEWIGEIPSHWECTRIKYFVNFDSGYSFKSDDYTENGIPLIRIGSLYNNILSFDRSPIFLPEEFESEYNQFVVQNNDILISMTGTLGKRDYGYSILYNEGFPSLLNQRVGRIRLSSDKIELSYLIYILLSESFLLQLFSKPTGTKQGNLSSDDIIGNYFGLPSLSEQQQIVSYLDEHTQLIDKTISTEEKRIELLKEYRQSLISEVVTGKRKVVTHE